MKVRVKVLGVEFVCVSSICIVWFGDYIDLGDCLYEYISVGNLLGMFFGFVFDCSDIIIVSSVIIKKE